MYKQLDIFGFMQPEEPPILLPKGAAVYLVNKADMIKCTVSKNRNSWVCGGNNDNRGYTLVRDSGGYTCTWNDSLGKEAFTDYESARQKADEYLKSHSGIILAGDIKPISTIAYSYMSSFNGKMTSFCCDLGNDTYYIKEYMTYEHIVKGKEAVKKFMEQQAFTFNEPKKIEGFVPTFKNMYRCTAESDWDYAECGYICAVG